MSVKPTRKRVIGDLDSIEHTFTLELDQPGLLIPTLVNGTKYHAKSVYLNGISFTPQLYIGGDKKLSFTLMVNHVCTFIFNCKVDTRSGKSIMNGVDNHLTKILPGSGYYYSTSNYKKYLDEPWTMTYSIKLLDQTVFEKHAPGICESQCGTNLRKIYNNKESSDVQINLQDGSTIHAHSLILNAGNKVLGAMLQSGFGESLDNCIDMKDHSPHTVTKYIKYLYGYHYNFTDECHKDVMFLDQYDEVHMVNTMLRHLGTKANNISAKEACEMYKNISLLGDKYGSIVKDVLTNVRSRMIDFLKDPSVDVAIQKAFYDLVFSPPQVK